MNVQSLKRGDLRQALLVYAEAETRAGRIETMSLRAAARDLGVSSGAVYRHFADKEALLMEVVRRGFVHLRNQFVSIRAEDSPAPQAEEAVRRAFRMGRAYMLYAQDNPTMWRLMFGRIGCLCRDAMMRDEALMRYSIRDAVEANFQDLWTLGVLSAQPDLQDVRFFWSSIHGAADLCQSGARTDASDVVAVSDQTVVRVLAAIGCPSTLIEAANEGLATQH